MTFTKGVLCSLSILDRYGDSIACREVAELSEWEDCAWKPKEVKA